MLGLRSCTFSALRQKVFFWGWRNLFDSLNLRLLFYVQKDNATFKETNLIYFPKYYWRANWSTLLTLKINSITNYYTSWTCCRIILDPYHPNTAAGGICQRLQKPVRTLHSRARARARCSCFDNFCEWFQKWVHSTILCSPILWFYFLFKVNNKESCVKDDRIQTSDLKCFSKTFSLAKYFLFCMLTKQSKQNWLL